jgi:hypothetical protein
MPSARDKCFKKAVEKLKDNGKLKDLDVQDQKRWVRDAASREWSQTNEIWCKVVGAVSRAWRAIDAKLGLPEGAINGTRIPDMTITPEGGKTMVVDNKFDGDKWRDGQREDYNEINEQQNGDPKAKNLQLNSDVCKCGDPDALEPVPVPVTAPMPFMVPGVNPVIPGEVPAVGGAGAGVPLGEPIFPELVPAF